MMNASIKYEVAGREVSRDEFLRAMQNNFHKMVAEQLVGLVTARLADVRCEIHSVAPTVVLVEQSGTNPSFVLRDPRNICSDIYTTLDRYGQTLVRDRK